MARITNNALTKLCSHSELLNVSLQEDFTNLKTSMLNEFDPERGARIYRRICDNSHTRAVLSEVTSDISSVDIDDGIPVFTIGSELIYDAYKKLCSISTESILFAVGNDSGNSYSVERLIELELDQSDYGYAKANSSFLSKVLIEREQYGSLLTCYFHAHPGKGIHSNHPSETDIDNQERYERGQYKAIGGIFSRDGYLRFFTDKLQYKVTILGKGVQHVSKGVYKLTDIS